MSIRLERIKKVYKGRTVLNIEEFEFKSGRVYAILGPNGSGKTTLLKIMSGVDMEAEGRVSFGDEANEYNNAVAYLPQKPYIFDLKVLDNVLLGMDKDKNSRQKAVEALTSVGMSDFKDARARSLSGGEAQRVALARTMVLHKKAVLLDEPATSMDVLSIKLIGDYIKKINKEDNATVIFTTHNPSQAISTADEVIILYEGRIAETGNPGDVLNSPKTEETKIFLENWRIAH